MSIFKTSLTLFSVGALVTLTACSEFVTSNRSDATVNQQQSDSRLSEFVQKYTEASSYLMTISAIPRYEVECSDNVDALLENSESLERLLKITDESDDSSAAAPSATRVAISLQQISQKTSSDFCRINLMSQVGQIAYERLLKELPEEVKGSGDEGLAMALIEHARTIGVTIEGLNKIYQGRLPSQSQQTQQFTNEVHNMISRVEGLRDQIASQSNRCDLVQCSLEHMIADKWVKDADLLVTDIQKSFNSGSTIAFELSIIKKHLADLRGQEKAGFEVLDLLNPNAL